jgi:hypothetical protein
MNAECPNSREGEPNEESSQVHINHPFQQSLVTSVAFLSLSGNTPAPASPALKR